MSKDPRITRVFSYPCPKHPTLQDKLNYCEKSKAEALTRGWKGAAQAWQDTIDALKA